MDMKMPIKQGTKLWVEFEAVEDVDLMDEKLLHIIAPDQPNYGNFKVNQLIFKPTAFNQDLVSDLLNVLRQHGVDYV